ncbi:TlyA family RNA methyltransferase [Sulfurovum sp. bin170]|uniref:23S rRNA (cytidine-2'-O)-methyltransferase TlyA n=1 Tax=Sulfurovum sp. bin170 TaxID=2695268 RepID=UPI0013DEC099|nr:TlyA family RNA methyltransferase [Sulfurovum sp. bin170]NEW60968.1 TlyA family RNA methyltransferase [Sulfurovum sp. bin170]
MQRLDKYLVENNLFESRNRAIDAIKRGKIFIDGKVAKPSTKCDENSNIYIDTEKFYVSRASKKLELFLEEYPIDLKDKRALDIGSSTGGFVQILLENGVKSVTAVDVGSNQLHHSLRDNPKVEIFEETDIREFRADKMFDIVTCDVSFISVLHIIDDIDRLSSRDMILLFKPQFEVGRGVKRDSRGVVINEKAIKDSITTFENKTSELGWELCYSTLSKLAGKSGNIEYMYHFRK